MWRQQPAVLTEARSRLPVTGAEGPGEAAVVETAGGSNFAHHHVGIAQQIGPFQAQPCRKRLRTFLVEALEGLERYQLEKLVSSASSPMRTTRWLLPSRYRARCMRPNTWRLRASDPGNAARCRPARAAGPPDAAAAGAMPPPAGHWPAHRATGAAQHVHRRGSCGHARHTGHSRPSRPARAPSTVRFRPRHKPLRPACTSGRDSFSKAIHSPWRKRKRPSWLPPRNCRAPASTQ